MPIYTTRQPHHFTPPDQLSLPEADRVSYLLATPTPFKLSEVRHRVRARPGAVMHTDLALASCLERGLKEIAAAAAAAGEEAADLSEQVATVEAFIEAKRTAFAALDGRDNDEIIAALEEEARRAAEIDELGNLLAPHYEPFRRMRNERATYAEIMRLELVRAFVVGWRGIDTPFTAGPDGDLAEDLLAVIPQLHLLAIEAQLNAMASPNEARAKNSASPSPSSSAPTVSRASRSSSPRRRRSGNAKGSSRSSPKSVSPASPSTPA